MPEKRKQHSIENEDQQNIRKIIDLFNQNLAENEQLLSEIYRSGNQCITQTDLILAASQNERADVLYYIINGPDILVHFTDDSIDDTEVNIRRTEAIRHALRLKDFNKVEMLYDFWCGSLHWDGYDINNIKMAGNVLKNARNACPKDDDEDQLQANIHCLLKYNAFQREIYKNRKNKQKVNKKKQKKKRAVLNKKKKKQKKKIAVLNKNNVDKINQRGPKETAIMIMRVLQIYDKYSRIEMIRRQLTDKEKELAIKANIADNSSTFYKILEYIYYEVYFRKIDFSVALLILENLYVISDHLKTRFNKTKQHFKDNPADEKFYENEANTYKEIESEIYHFIYRTSEDWRLYIPENRRVTLTTEHTVNDNGQKSIVKQTLDVTKLSNGPVIYLERESFKRSIEKLKVLLEEYFLRDDTAVGANKKVKILLNDNYLQTLNYIRDYYSLVKIVYYIGAIENTANCDVVMIERVLQVVGEMLKSTEKTLHLSESTQALLQTAISVETVGHLQKIRHFLSHMTDGELSTRIRMINTHTQTFEVVKRDLIMIKEIINPILGVFESIVDKSFLETGVRHLEQRIEGLPYEAKRRVDEIYNLYKKIVHGKDLFVKSGIFYQDDWRHPHLTPQLLQEIPFVMNNKEAIDKKVQLVKQCISVKVITMLPSIIPNVRQMLDLIIQNNNDVKTFNQEISKYNAIEQMPEYSDVRKINEIKDKVKQLMGDNNHNLQIVQRLLDNIKPYKAHWKSIKEMLSFCLTECELSKKIQGNLTDTTTPTDACAILTELENICAKEKSYCVPNSSIKPFEGIKTLYNEQIKSIKKINDKRQSREELIRRLIERLDLLKQTLSYPQQKSLSQLVRRFDHDVQFRITIEMVLADIANVLAECKIYLMYKSSKLLRNIDLGNVLDHGNPFLEVIGDVFNSHDLAAEWLDKAMMFAKDSKSIEALYELFKGKMDYEIILEGATPKMDDQQKLLYEQFKESRNWKALLALYDFQK